MKSEWKKGQLLKKTNETNTCLYRVLALEEESAMVIDCVKKCMPVWVSSSELVDFEAVEEKCVEKDLDVLEDYASNVKKIIHQRFTMISAILPFISNEPMRTEAIKKVAEEYAVSTQTVRKYLCEYLVSMDIRSLAPQEKCTDKPLTKEEKNMRKALNKYFYTSKKRTLKDTYTLMLRDSYCDSEGKLIDKYPSFYQFRYFFRKKYNTKQTEYISRNGLSYYQRNQRPLFGDGIRKFASGVGVGMLDSTICDIYLVSENGNLIGRPVLNACVDGYSGLCMGYALGWEGGTYSLKEMLLNVISDKVEHCRKFGIEIASDEWPSDKLPGKLVTDKGSEYKGSNLEQIVELGVELVNLPAFRPDLKGNVEKFFDCVQGYYKSQLKGKGVVEPDFQERGVADYRKSACLTLKQFETILLHCILFYNSKRIVDFPYTQEMLDKGIKPYANEIWQYGCQQDTCNLIRVSNEQLIKVLLPRTRGKFSRFGLLVNGLHYHNIHFREQYLQGKECEVAYNPDDVTKIWLIENGAYIDFELIESRFKDKYLSGVEDMKRRKKELLKQEQGKKMQAEIDLVNHIQVISDNALRTAEPSIKNIRDNRKKEQGKIHRNFVKEVGLNV
ncbi:MAG: Mu transposase C-terminal domain-containing protein [Lachnospiraceae bacterium]|nr:Mu transposase C-terminal domain-containing protein [Lachnospiraceae bacterium]